MVYDPCSPPLPGTSNTPSEQSNFCTILYTTICITIHEPVFGQISQGATPNRLKDNRKRHSWALSDEVFEIWRVKKLNQLSSQQDSLDKPKPLLESAHDASIHFQNGEGEHIGRLILEPLQESAPKIDLNSLTEDSSLPARWEEHKLGFLATVQAKEEAIEERTRRWSERHPKGVLPWAVSHAMTPYKPVPFVVEHIRGGDLNAFQKAFRTYI